MPPSSFLPPPQKNAPPTNLMKGDESAAAPSPLATDDNTNPPNPAATRHFSISPPDPSDSSPSSVSPSLPPLPLPPVLLPWRKRMAGHAHVNSSAMSSEQRTFKPPGGTPLPLLPLSADAGSGRSVSTTLRVDSKKGRGSGNEMCNDNGDGY